ncbi:MAG: hypothetical protein WCA98_10345 [Candidatus Acidiferrales bacterium]
MPYSSRVKQTWMASIAVPLLLASLYPLQKHIRIQTESIRAQKDELFFTSGPMLKKLSLGYSSILADIYWTRAVQYYGGRLANQDPHFELLSPLLNVTTALDPHLIVAYRFGAMFLAEPEPVGAGQPDLAIDLVKQGIAANPRDWELYYDLGFIYYFHTKDYKEAAQVFWQASEVPGAPSWLKAFAASVAEKGNSRDTSRFMWLEAYKTSNDPRIRNNALNHLARLQVEDDLEKLAAIALEYQKRAGHFPASGQELVYAGVLRMVPKDPEGYPYMFGPDGAPSVDPSSPFASHPGQTPANH